MMVSCHDMMVSCHDMMISCHDMTILEWMGNGSPCKFLLAIPPDLSGEPLISADGWNG